MQFKVGDRVEALRGPSNTEHDDYLGPGTVTAVRTNNRLGEDCQLDLDMGEKSWWFAEESLRPLKPNPTPSITVGTQVRLTGVAMSSGGDGDVVTIESDGFVFGVPVGALEVIRQPFKRGEVVQYIADAEGKADGEDYVVVKDEESDSYDLLIVGTHHGDEVFCADPSLFERRP